MLEDNTLYIKELRKEISDIRSTSVFLSVYKNAIEEKINSRKWLVKKVYPYGVDRRKFNLPNLFNKCMKKYIYKKNKGISNYVKTKIVVEFGNYATLENLKKYVSELLIINNMHILNKLEKYPRLRYNADGTRTNIYNYYKDILHDYDVYNDRVNKQQELTIEKIRNLEKENKLIKISLSNRTVEK